MNSYIYRELPLDLTNWLLVSASLIRQNITALFRMLPTEVHMLRETTSSEKQVLKSLLLTIPFSVVLINIRF